MEKYQLWWGCACNEGKAEEINEKTLFWSFSTQSKLLGLVYWPRANPSGPAGSKTVVLYQMHSTASWQWALGPRLPLPLRALCPALAELCLAGGTAGTSLLLRDGKAPSRNMVCGGMTQNEWFGAPLTNSNKTSNLELPKFFCWVKMLKQIIATLPHIYFCHVPSKRERIFLSQFGGK